MRREFCLLTSEPPCSRCRVCGRQPDFREMLGERVDRRNDRLPVLYDILAVVHSDSYRSSLRGISENGRWAAGTMRLAIAGRNARHPVAH